MKDAKSIITKHFYNNPKYKTLSAANECGMLMQLMPNNVKPLIYFCYVKAKTLFIVVRHPVGLSELKRDSSINMIKGLLRAIIAGKELQGLSSVFSDVVDIKIYIAKIANKERNLKPLPTIKTALNSRAEFKNLAKNSAVFAAFERLREVIKERNCKA